MDCLISSENCWDSLISSENFQDDLIPSDTPYGWSMIVSIINKDVFILIRVKNVGLMKKTHRLGQPKAWVLVTI